MIAHVKKLGPRPSVSEQLEVNERRERLQKRISSWSRKAAEFLQGEEEFEDAPLGDGDEWDDQPALEEISFGAEHPDAPEQAKLPLPSAMTAGRSDLQAQQELLLRQGQANDALHAIRIKISYKAGLFRGLVQQSNSQRTKTRAWDEVSAVESSVRHHARIYSRAREAMVSLGAGPEVLARYQVLRKEHLQARTSVIDPLVQRHRNEQLSWFWKMDARGDMDGDSWMQECRLILLLYSGLCS